MAKGKRAVALFEVIHSGKGIRSSPPTPVAAPLTTPRPPAGPSAVRRFFGGLAATGSRAWTAAMRRLTTPPLSVNTAPEPAEPAVAGDDAAPVDVRLDRDRQRITFRFTYTSAAIASFAVAVLLGLAYLVGRQGSPELAADDPFLSAPLRADVLEVGRNAPPLPSLGSSGGATTPPANPPAAMPQRTSAPPVAAPNPPANASAGPRVIGLNYVVIQSFLDPALANDAAAMLKQAGIDCTVEQGLPNYAGKSYSVVVGTRGFTPAEGESNPDFVRYLAAIREVGRQFAAKTKGKDAREFDPRRYKWQVVR